MTWCLACGLPYDAIGTRCLCPWCGFKGSCSDGSAGLVQWVPATWVLPGPRPGIEAALRYVKARYGAVDEGGTDVDNREE